MLRASIYISLPLDYLQRNHFKTANRISYVHTKGVCCWTQAASWLKMRNDTFSTCFLACNQPTNFRASPKEPGHNLQQHRSGWVGQTACSGKRGDLERCLFSSAPCCPVMALRSDLIFWALATSEHHLLLLALPDLGVWFSGRSSGCICSGTWEKSELHPYFPVGSLSWCPVIGSEPDTPYFRWQV